MKKRCDKVIIVEGKYDKIRLESFLDATILTTEGFGIFKDSEKRNLIRALAEKKGLVVLADPDGAGKIIRGHIRTITGGKNVTDLYIPQTKGKEKRKSAPSREGFLGVEGIDNAALESIFVKSGVLLSDSDEKAMPRYTKEKLYSLGYTGKANASEKRRAVLELNALPPNLSTSAFLDAVNLLGIELE